MNKVNKLITEISELQSLNFSNLQAIEEMRRLWKVGDVISIGESSNHLIYSDPKRMRFVTKIPPGESFECHFHNLPESCRVLSGQLADKQQPGKIWRMNDTCIFQPFVGHTPYNPSKTDWLILIVDFDFDIAVQPVRKLVRKKKSLFDFVNPLPFFQNTITG